MEMTSYVPGTPSWVDLGTPDADGASTFYSSLFGWDIEEGPPEAGGYRMCMLKGQPVAGMGPQMNTDIPPFWTTYVSVTDVDASVAKVKELGGQVFADPMDVMTAGRMAVCADASGAAFSLWQPKDMPGAGLVNETGTLGWNELMTRDIAGATAFYGSLFGWGADTVPDGSYTEWKVEGRSVGGMMAMPDEMPPQVPSMWGVYFLVDDADAAAAKVTSLGGSVMRPPADIEPGRFAVVADPYGAAFSVMKLNEGVGP